MNNWLNIEKARRVNIVEDLSKKMRLPSVAIEKDWWVTMVLKALFATPFASHLSFKGGTSLSKCWSLIERFSEDVDIAIDREFLGFVGELSKTQISDKLRRASCSFVRETMKIEVEKQLSMIEIDDSLFEIKINMTSVTTTDPETIEVYYHSIFADVPYVQSRVLIEVSGRSMSEPIERVGISSIISQAFPNATFAEKPFPISAVSPKRTFLEKACLLHEEFSKSTIDIRHNRMSRHIYDLEKLMDTEIAKEAIEDIDLYRSVIEHRKKFVGLMNFDYSTLLPQAISFVPPTSILPKWKEDYEYMRANMIYGDSLPFDRLIERIADLNKKFRKIDLG